MVIAIALGGAAGAVARYFVSRLMVEVMAASWQPVATFIVNITGCGAMGLITGLVLAGAINLGEAQRGFLLIGFLGALTTFSAFSLDTFKLLERGANVSAFIYVLGSVLASLIAFALCAYLARLIAGDA